MRSNPFSLHFPSLINFLSFPFPVHSFYSSLLFPPSFFPSFSFLSFPLPLPFPFLFYPFLSRLLSFIFYLSFSLLPLSFSSLPPFPSSSFHSLFHLFPLLSPLPHPKDGSKCVSLLSCNTSTSAASTPPSPSPLALPHQRAEFLMILTPCTQ